MNGKHVSELAKLSVGQVHSCTLVGNAGFRTSANYYKKTTKGWDYEYWVRGTLQFVRRIPAVRLDPKKFNPKDYTIEEQKALIFHLENFNRLLYGVVDKAPQKRK